MSNPIIEFSQVTKRFRTGQVGLEQVDFSIERGEMVFLTGHSGSGKSTLLKLIMLMERPTAGTISVGRHNLNRLRRWQIPLLRRQIGVVFQNHQLLFKRTVFENVALPLYICGHQPKDVGKSVRAALDKVGLLHKEKRYPLELSGGEQQRVGIARALVNKPPLLLADEPTGNLDPQLSEEIMRLFLDFNQVGVSVLIASHDLDLVGRLKHRVLSLQQGRLVGDLDQ